MLNIVTEGKDFPAAVLIRGVKGHVGPGRLTRALGIDLKLNGKSALPENGLWFEARDEEEKESIQIHTTTRIGVKYAGPIWAEKEYRFLLAEEVGVSTRRRKVKR